MIKIGMNKFNKEVFLLENELNGHILATGCSGSGKSTAMLSIVVRKAIQSKKVIVFNHGGCLGGMQEELRKQYADLCERIDVGNNGIGLPLFQPISVNGVEESVDCRNSRVTGMLTMATGLTMLQEKLLSEAIENSVSEMDDTSTDKVFKDVTDFLEFQKTSNSQIVLHKTRLFRKDGIFKEGDFLKSDKPIIELDLNSLEERDQASMIRFILDYLYRVAIKGEFISDGISIYLDESQNLDYSEDSPVYRLVNEGRKHGVSLLLATPNLFSSKKKNMNILTQFGTCLYFKPLESECHRIAGFIKPDKVDAWSFQLSRLVRGEVIVKGQFLVEGQKQSDPFKVKVIIPDLSVSENKPIIFTKPVHHKRRDNEGDASDEAPAM